MPLSKEAKERIAQQATNQFAYTTGFEDGLINVGKLELLIKQAYIAGTEAQAERAEGLVRELNEVLEAMEGKYWHVAKSMLKETLTKYTNGK